MAADRPKTSLAAADGATLKIDVIVRSQRWRQGVADVTRLCAETARRAYVVAAGDDPDAQSRDAQVSIVLTSDRAVQALNRTFRGRDQATNVLSFPVAQAPAAAAGCSPPPRLLGDVVIAFGTTAAEAAAAGKDLGHHLRHLIVHGILHVLGYDHQTEGDAAAMERLEAAILACFGVSDPYASAAEHPA